MDDAAGQSAPGDRRRRSRPPAYAPGWLLGAALLLAAALCAAYAARRSLAAALIERYLAARGVPAFVKIETLEPHQVSADIRAGSAATPDASAHLAASIVWEGFSPSIGSVSILDARIQARLEGQRVSFGVLDRLAGQWPRSRTGTRAPAPDIRVEGAQLRLSAPQGTLETRLDAALAGGRLQRLRVRLLPAVLQSGDLAVQIADGDAQLRADGEAIALSARVSGAATVQSAGGAAHARNLILQIDRAMLRWNAASAAATVESATGSIEALGVELEGSRLDRVAFGWEATAARLTLAARSPEATAQLRTSLGLEGLCIQCARGGLTVPRALVSADGPVKWQSGHWKLGAQLSVDVRGNVSAAWVRPLLQRVQALGVQPSGAPSVGPSSFQIAANRLRGSYEAGQGQLALERPVVIRTGRRMRVVLQPAAGAAAIEGSASERVLRGAFELSARGSGLPAIEARVHSYRIGSDRESGILADARLAISAAGIDTGPLHALTVTADGSVRTGRGHYELTLTRCAELQALTASLGSTQLTNLKVQLCPLSRPLLSADQHGWKAHAQWHALAAELPAAELGATAGSGRVELAGSSSALASARADIDSLQLSDRAVERRFADLRVKGTALLSKGDWEGALAVGLPEPAAPLATVSVRHSPATGSGEARFQGAMLAFTRTGLQPVMISPLLRSLSHAEGAASADGVVAWTAGGLSSHGELRLENLAISSALGSVSRVATHTELTSLLPLRSAPHQRITIEQIGTLIPMTQFVGQFEWLPDAIVLEAAQAGFAGGTIALDPVTVPFDSAASIDSRLRLESIDLDKLMAASTLSDRIHAQIQVSGVVPFSWGPTGVRIVQGSIAAIGPGQLSISRSVWGVPTQGQNNAVRDFAYQALEHLAVDQLDGTINSEPNGRVGLLLHVKGRHEPPVGAEARVGVLDLLKGRAFDRPLPLPKGTPIDLTLDSSLNLGEVLGAYRATLGSGR